jgi:hypothetical protein
MAMLRRLLADELDERAPQRERLVAAYLAGGSIPLPLGARVGGDFENIPICASPPTTSRATLAPEWGMHLVDMNVVLGDLQELAASQGAAWRAAHP